MLLALVLLLRVVFAEDPFGGISRPVALAAGALMLYALWTLISAEWSDSTFRALVDFNRVLLYLLALLLFGSLRHTPGRLRTMVWGLAAGLTAVCVTGLLTRVLPDEFTIDQAVQIERLAHPIGYWSALGLAAALGIVLCTHLTSSEREPAAARVLAAAALPALAATLLFTFSRGPLAVACIGVVIYVLLARPWGLFSALIAAAPATAIAVIAAYRADLLASDQPTIPEAVAQGHDVALVILICSVAAAGMRLILVRLDSRLEEVRLSSTAKRRLALGGVALCALALGVALIATDLPDRIDRQADTFTRSDVAQTGDNRDRLLDFGVNRLDLWEVSLDGFNEAPLKGQGAGTFAVRWEQERPTDSDSEEGHSLYLEVMGELGLVGIALLAVALLALLVGVARRMRGPNRALYAAVFTAALVWALHVVLDWEWEIPGVTLWLYALAGFAAAAAPAWQPAGDRAEPGGPRPLVRGLVGVGCVVLAATPMLMAVSQARLNESVRAFALGDCARASEKARASIDAVGSRPEPYELIAYCDARGGFGGSAQRTMRAAVERDPDNWEYRYGLAVVRASAGRDPRRDARHALRLNPREAQARAAVKSFAATGPRAWRSAAAEIGLVPPEN